MTKVNLEEIREKVNLAELIGQHTSVQKSKALCPFHPDTNPSLSISESKGLWHCFVCGAGGDAFTFVMKAEEVSFLEAVKILCDRYGITHTYNSPQEASEAKRQLNRQRSKILELNQKREEKLDSLRVHDLFLGGLWKRIYRSDYTARDAILESIEGCFMELEESHKQIEKEFEDERKKIYSSKTS